MAKLSSSHPFARPPIQIFLEAGGGTTAQRRAGSTRQERDIFTYKMFWLPLSSKPKAL